MIIDLSHLIQEDMPLFSGAESPVIRQLYSVEKDGYKESFIQIQSHIGTHIDAPSHMIAKGKNLNEYSIDKFCGKAFTITVPLESSTIDIDLLKKYKPNYHGCDFILFHTNWSNYWSTPKYMEGFPSLTEEACEYLCRSKIKGIGFDCISADSINSTDYKNHFKILSKDILIIENLCKLDKIALRKVQLHCLPLKYEYSDGAPARVIATL